MYQRYQLSHTDAWKIVETIKAELEKGNKGATIAVADSQGELLAFCGQTAASCRRSRLRSTKLSLRRANKNPPVRSAIPHGRNSGR